MTTIRLLQDHKFEGLKRERKAGAIMAVTPEYGDELIKEGVAEFVTLTAPVEEVEVSKKKKRKRKIIKTREVSTKTDLSNKQNT